MLKVWLITLGVAAFISWATWTISNLWVKDGPLSEGSVTYWVRKCYFEELHKGTFV